MKLKEVAVGKTYAVKVSERIVPVTLTHESNYGGWVGRNERTGRNVRIRSAQKLRFEVKKGPEGKWQRV